jgi:hypothetical protein
MTLPELLAELESAGVRLQAHGDQLDIDAPRGALTPDLLARLQAHKPDLLDLLRNPQPHATAGNAGEIWQAALEQLNGDPLFPPDLLAQLRAAGVRWASELPEDDRTGLPKSSARPNG